MNREASEPHGPSVVFKMDSTRSSSFATRSASQRRYARSCREGRRPVCNPTRPKSMTVDGNRPFSAKICETSETNATAGLSVKSLVAPHLQERFCICCIQRMVNEKRQILISRRRTWSHLPPTTYEDQTVLFCVQLLPYAFLCRHWQLHGWQCFPSADCRVCAKRIKDLREWALPLRQKT